MPIIKSAIKRAKQNLKRRALRQPYATILKSSMRKLTDLAKEGKKEEAVKVLPQVFRAIDMAVKRNIIHRNNAARKKSRMNKMVAVMK